MTRRAAHCFGLGRFPRRHHKIFSYWEQWPADTGHAPSLEVLGRLAELYACQLPDLVSDVADFRSADEAH